MYHRKINGITLELFDENYVQVLALEEYYQQNLFQIKVRGQITAETAHDFEDEIIAAVSVCPKIELDFSEVRHMSGFAQGVLLSVQNTLDKIENSDMKIINVNEDVMREFQKTCLTELLQVFPAKE